MTLFFEQTRLTFGVQVWPIVVHCILSFKLHLAPSINCLKRRFKANNLITEPRVEARRMRTRKRATNHGFNQTKSKDLWENLLQINSLEETFNLLVNQVEKRAVPVATHQLKFQSCRQFFFSYLTSESGYKPMEALLY